MRRAGGIAFAMGVCVLLAIPSEASASDFSRYRPRMMKEQIRDYPRQGGLVITNDIPIRSKVVYSGEFRDLPNDSRRLIALWSESMNVPGMPQAFQQELKVAEAGINYWVPAQEVLVPSMKRELRPGEEIELFIIYIGQVAGRHIFLVNEFTHESPH
jgi:hypothetical protein